MSVGFKRLLDVGRRRIATSTLERKSRSLARRIQLEQLEARMLMCNDFHGPLQSRADGSLASGAELSGMLTSRINPATPYDGDAIAGDPNGENWIQSLDEASLDVAFAAYAPALLGVFTPPSLSFNTLANGMPILNSLVGAPTAIFLDFDGDTTNGTYPTTPYDVDGDSTTFNAAEQATIAEAWRHIATYFAMFNTNVTTVQPPTTTPKAWSAIGNNRSGGFANTNQVPNSVPRSFNPSSDARSRQSGMAHELGHNWGLNHQSDFDLLGVETKDYTSGYDSLHGSIMGVDYAQSVHKWFIGHTVNASGLQDDMKVISDKIKSFEPVGGDGYRPDDFGGTIATATALTSNNDVQAIGGIIERMSDVDAFSFTSNGLPTTVAAFADTPSGLDLKLEILDAAGVLVAAEDSALNDQEITLTLPVGTYYALLSSHQNYGDLGTYTLSVRTLPQGWIAQDVGGTGYSGFSQYNSATNTFTIAGAGADIGGTGDEMQFAMQTLTGDGSIVARVASLANTSANAKAGIEIRESTAANAKHVSLTPTYSSGVKLISRGTTGGSSTTASSAAAAFAPVWVRLTRAGNVFTASTSVNGTTWTQLGTPQTVVMNAKVQIGLVTTAQTDTKLNLATFNNVLLTGSLGDPVVVPNSLPAPTGLTVTRSTGSDFTISWNNQLNETGYRIERSGDGIVFTTAGTTAADVTTFEDTGRTGTMRYFYRVRVLNASGASVASSIVSEINRPSPVTVLDVTSYSATSLVLDWRDTSGETGYRIDRSSDGTNFTLRANVGINIPSYTDTGLASGTTYFYRVTPTSGLGDGTAVVTSGATRLNQVTGLAFDELTSSQTRIRWTDLPNESNYKIQRSTDGTTFTDLATLPGGITTYTDTTVAGSTEYYYRVIASSATSVGFENTIFSATPAALPLPYPWTSRDIGTITGSGATSQTTGTFKIISSGSTIGGTADGFRFTSQILLGDGSITARVASLEDTSTTAGLGVMIRESLAANSRSVFVSLRPGTAAAAMLSRSTVGGNTASINGASVAAPYWVRLARAGNIFTGSTSPDGVTWTQVGQVTVTMSASVSIGLAATAGTTTELNTGTASSVTLTGDIRTGVVMNRQVFYNRSSSTVFGDGSGNPTAAIDTSKQALLPGQATSFANYTNYSRGLNGIILDIAGVVTATASDFLFADWDGIAAAGFLPTSALPTVTLIPSGGLNSSTRVKIEFNDNAIRNTWLRVTVLANANTDLQSNDVFYFGNAVGDVNQGNQGTPINVESDSTDLSFVRQNQSLGANSVPISNTYDINRDGRVNALDTALVRQNLTGSKIRYFTAPVSLRLAGVFLASKPVESGNPWINGLNLIPLTGTTARKSTSETPALAANPYRQPATILSANSRSTEILSNSLVRSSMTADSDLSKPSLESMDDFFRKLGLQS